MKTDSNSPTEMFKLWQEKTQEFFSDPKMVELMMQNAQVTQSFLNKINELRPENAKYNAAQNNDSMDDTQNTIELLNIRVTALEQRIAKLEAAARKDK